VSDLEDQIDATQKLIRAEAERIEKLKQAKKESREGFGGKKFDAQMTLLDKKIDKDEENVKKRADADRKQLDQFRKNTKGNPQAQAWADAQERRIDKKEQRDLNGLEKRKERIQRGMLDSREANLKGRAQSELDAAKHSQADGNAGLAKEQFEKSRKTLEELQQLQLEQVGSRPLPEGNAALGRAESTQRKIDAAFDEEIKAAQEQQDQEKVHLQELQTMLENAKALKKEVEGTPFVSEADMEAITRMKAEFQAILHLKQAIAGTQAASGDPFGQGGSLPGRAAGGPVTAGGMYQTGEHGRELFIPAVNGTVVNHRDTMGILNTVASLFASPSGGSTTANSHVDNRFRQSVTNVHGSQLTLEQIERHIAFKEKNRQMLQD